MKEVTGRLAATFRAYLEKVPFLKIVSWKKDARLGEFTPDIVIKVSLADSRAGDHRRNQGAAGSRASRGRRSISSSLPR